MLLCLTKHFPLVNVLQLTWGGEYVESRQMMQEKFSLMLPLFRSRTTPKISWLMANKVQDKIVWTAKPPMLSLLPLAASVQMSSRETRHGCTFPEPQTHPTTLHCAVTLTSIKMKISSSRQLERIWITATESKRKSQELCLNRLSYTHTNPQWYTRKLEHTSTKTPSTSQVPINETFSHLSTCTLKTSCRISF